MDSDDARLGSLIDRIAPSLISDRDRYSDMWDMDEIFWKEYLKPWDIGRAFYAFEWIIGNYEPLADELGAFLWIWLPQTADLSTRIPLLDAIASIDANSAHPPGVGFTKKARPRQPYEHYEVPVEQGLVRYSWGTVRAYYKCFRFDEALRNDEAYDRALVFEHWQLPYYLASDGSGEE
jgi:hypothetical protein